MCSDADQRRAVERLAYSKWEAAGRPQCDGQRFWHEAEREHNASTNRRRDDNLAPGIGDMPRNERWLWRIRTVVSLAGLTLAGIGAWNAYDDPKNRTWLLINTLVWSIGPPLWFVVEYVILFPWLDNNPTHRDDLKYGQGLAKAFWAGIAALLVALYKLPPTQ